MKKENLTLTAYTAAHFAVDLGCGWLITALSCIRLGMTAAAGAVILYNFLAFGLQFIIGGIVDCARERGRLLHAQVALLGCFGVAVALLIGTRSLWLAVTLVGLGNAAFHVGGGIDSLIYADGKMGRCGIFVSSGAVGVALGMLMGGILPHMLYIPAAAVGLCAGLIVLFCRRPAPVSTLPAEGDGACPLCVGAGGLVLCLFAVLVRSYGGFLFSMPWKQGFWLVMAAAVAAAVGKAVGGLLSDRFGGRAVGAASLALSVPLVIFGNESVALSLAGIVCFNAAMPITLHTAAARLPQREGFAFGLTTLALLVGFLFSGVALSPMTADIAVGVMGISATVAIWLSSPGRGERT